MNSSSQNRTQIRAAVLPANFRNKLVDSSVSFLDSTILTVVVTIILSILGIIITGR